MKIETLQVLNSPSEKNPFLVVFKPAGIPSAPLFEGDESILTSAIALYPQISEVHGKKEVEHGLVHRIDTETSGLVLIATTQQSYDSLLLSQKEGKFEKWYLAEIEQLPDCARILGAFPPPPESSKNAFSKKPFVVESFFRAYGQKGREVRPVTEEAGRSALKKSGTVLYTTEISLTGKNIALCRIKAGYRHQVRCHLAWCGLPVKGDKTYNPNEKISENETETEQIHGMKFTACKISFPHPLTQIPLTFQM